ncbi:MAG: carbohydrate-binding protein [Vicinamibacterales bacterium]
MSHLQRLSTLLPLFSLLCIPAAHAQPSIPAGFADAHVASVPLPTAISATPDGRLLITSQIGQLYAVVDGVLQGPILDLAEKTCAYRERGLSSVAVDPGFATNRRIYLAYTFNKFGNCAAEMVDTPVGRVSRFTMNADGTIDIGSEEILIDNIPSVIGFHNQGDLKFGRDGNLYVSVGDGGCDYAFDSACFDSNDAARSLNTLVGKILRITPDGDVPSDNPFMGPDSARCNMGGGTTATVCQEIFATGLRNPWRMAFDPNAPGTRFFINDVGQDTWEEINEGLAAADYGWNRREGFCANGSTTDCSPIAPPGLKSPLFAYGHDEGCASITGGAFVPSGFWPGEFDGVYLFSDYVCGSIFTLTRAADGTQVRGTFISGLGGSSATDLYFAPYGDSVALYYATYGGGGEIRRIVYTGTANRAPTARLTATPTFGAPPLAIDFDASASTDPDGDQLSVTWDFGDGLSQTDGAMMARHTYTSAGTYTAVVRVTDGSGEASAAALRIDVGNGPPEPSIISPSSDLRFAVGDEILLSGSAVDPEDGILPSSALTWRVILHHNTHTHGFLPVTAGNGIVFRAPGPENVDAALTSYLEVELTATDKNNLSARVTQVLLPRTVQVQFFTDPAGARLRIDQADVATPATFTSWVNASINVEAPPQTGPDASPLSFVSWSDGGAAAHSIVTPQADGSYTARFARGSLSASLPGRIEAENFDSGGSGNSFVDATPGNQGGAYRTSDVDIEPAVDAGGGFNVGWTEAGEWLAYSVQVITAGSYDLEFRVASAGAGGLFHLEVNGVDVTGRLTLPDTGDWQRWTTVTVTARLESGPQLWRLVMDQNGPSGVVGNFNWIRGLQVVPVSASSPFGGVATSLPGRLEAEDFDLGAEAVAYQDLSPGNSGGEYRVGDVDVESSGDEGWGYNVGWVSPGEWLQYTVNVSSAGIYDLEFRVASPGPGGTFHVEVNGMNVTGTLVVPATGDWQAWTTVKRAGVALAAGEQVWRLVIDGVGASGSVGNFNYVRVVAADGPLSPPPATAQEIVIHAVDIPVQNLHGNWTSAADSTAASGVSLASTDFGAATVASPLPSPADYVDVSFTAQANVRYRLWIRLKAADGNKFNDSIWVQFSGAVDGTGAPRYRLDSGQALNVNQATCADCPTSGWGWQNHAYWESDNGEVWFSASGTQNLRIQVREDGVSVDQIVLSPAQFINAAPGPATNDQTIVRKP